MTSEIKYLKSLLLRTTCFGTLFSDIEWNGKIIRPREGSNGFFYEIPPFGNFNPGSDLHVSIFDDSGFAKAHITFKPYPKEPLAFHYGYKLKKSLFEEFWITGINPYNEEITEKIYNDIINVYRSVLKKIYINRPYLTPYKFNPHGTTGRVRNSEQKKFIFEEYNQQDRTPPGYLFDKKVETPLSLKPTGAVKKKRVSEFFKKGRLFNG